MYFTLLKQKVYEHYKPGPLVLRKLWKQCDCVKTGNRSIKNNRNVMIPIKYSYRQRNTTQKSYNITSVLFIVVDVDIYTFTHFV